MPELVPVPKESEFKKLLKDCFSSQSGDYDPARVIGYIFLACICLTFIILFWYVTIKTGTFLSNDFTQGSLTIGGLIIMVAGGVLVKAPTENPVDYRQIIARNTNLSGFTRTTDNPRRPGDANQ